MPNYLVEATTIQHYFLVVEAPNPEAATALVENMDTLQFQKREETDWKLGRVSETKMPVSCS